MSWVQQLALSPGMLVLSHVAAFGAVVAAPDKSFLYSTST
jgi:hypothetical protein